MNFERAMRVARRRGPIVLICMVVAAASAYVLANREPRQYTSAASLNFANNQIGAVATGLTPAYAPLTQTQQDTNVQLVGLGDIAAKTAAQLGPRWRPGEVAAAVAAAPDSDTSIVTVSATASTPKLARKIANTYANVFVAEQLQASTAALNGAERLVNEQYLALSATQRAAPQGLALADRAQSLALLAKLQTGNVSVVGQAPLPSAPSAPKVSRDAALGAVIGLLIGVAIAFMIERLDRRIRDPEELEEVYESPLLASVAHRSQYKVLSTLGQSQGSSPPSIYDEVFTLLRSYLRYFSVDRELRTLLVISAGPGEGKTTVSYNLAKAAAVLGTRVLLVEGDLRRGTTISPLVRRADPGLADVLIGDARVEEAIHSVEVGANGVLDVLVAGEVPPPNPGELVESRAMEAVLERARAVYDFVVIDTPPLNLIADAIPLLSKVDGVIVVGRVGKTSRDAASQLRKKLSSLRVPVLGIVANGVRRPSVGTYRGGYARYGYYKARNPVTVPSSNGANGANGAIAADGGSETRGDVRETA